MHEKIKINIFIYFDFNQIHYTLQESRQQNQTTVLALCCFTLDLFFG